MPIERVSKAFKDLSMTLQVNPINYDIIALKNENAIARSIRNLVFTNPGERFFNNNLGSGINKSLFENIDEITASIIKDEIENTIKNYEPRVNLTNIAVDPDYENNNFNVFVQYTIVGIDVFPQQLSFALQPTR